jgi:3-methylfumaryl-CoA hydratase
MECLLMDDASNLHQWIGRTEESDDVITATPCAALAATLDHPAARPAEGYVLPALWHWLYFLPLHRQSELGPDGHAERGGFLPPIALPRRMWAGSEFRFHAPLRVGDRMRRVSTIAGIDEKHGRSGPLVFVKVQHKLYRGGHAEPALTEIHNIVYRGAANPNDVPPAAQNAIVDSGWHRKIVPDDVLLFRYSALTFNGHRIHYDRRYVTEVEGYPGLIVHGPLIATLLMDLLRRERPDATVASFAFKAVRPTFDVNAFHVRGEPSPDGKTVRLWAHDHEGLLTMDATAVLA